MLSVGYQKAKHPWLSRAHVEFSPPIPIAPQGVNWKDENPALASQKAFKFLNLNLSFDGDEEACRLKFKTMADGNTSKGGSYTVT